MTEWNEPCSFGSWTKTDYCGEKQTTNKYTLWSDHLDFNFVFPRCSRDTSCPKQLEVCIMLSKWTECILARMQTTGRFELDLHVFGDVMDQVDLLLVSASCSPAFVESVCPSCLTFSQFCHSASFSNCVVYGATDLLLPPYDPTIAPRPPLPPPIFRNNTAAAGNPTVPRHWNYPR